MAGWASGSSTGSWSSGDPGLESFTSSRGCQVHHVQGKLLSGEDAYRILDRNKTQLNPSGSRMLETLGNMESHDFQLIQQELPVSYLQHVTDEDSMGQIYNQGGFRIINQTSRPGFKDLSFWSAVIASEDIEAAREMSYEDARGVLRMLPPQLDRRYERKFKEQFANSPAFNPFASRYGNFKFSFPLFSLMDLYQVQHCRGEEPQLRILGTDMYKQEMVHYILVHSPDKSGQFRNLPRVRTVLESSKSLPFVYKKEGILYWRPESTSSEMTVLISAEGIAQCPEYCEFFNEHGSCCHMKVWSMWNHLVFAFHLPNNRCLKVPEGELLKNLTACSIDEPPLLEESKCLEIEEAEDIIQQIQEEEEEEEKNENNVVYV